MHLITVENVVDLHLQVQLTKNESKSSVLKACLICLYSLKLNSPQYSLLATALRSAVPTCCGGIGCEALNKNILPMRHM